MHPARPTEEWASVLRAAAAFWRPEFTGTARAAVPRARCGR
jgi:hypothetical protein